MRVWDQCRSNAGVDLLIRLISGLRDMQQTGMYGGKSGPDGQ